MKVYEILIEVKAGEKLMTKGICWHVEAHPSCVHDTRLEWFENREEAFAYWSGFSGHPVYPVGGKDEYHFSDSDLWANPERHGLLNHLIEWFKERDI